VTIIKEEEMLKTQRDNRKFLQLVGAKSLIVKLGLASILLVALLGTMLGTTSAPQASAKTVTAQSHSTSQVSSIITQVFGSYASGAIQVARCESGLNPYAVNPYSFGGSRAIGVFQILYPSTWYGTSQAGASPYDAYANVRAAHDIFVRDGHSWREWTCQP
jgi:hypothetical protein